MLKLEQVSKTFYPNTGNEKRAMDHLDLLVNTGEFVTVIGSNGAGKSTTMKLILGMTSPDSGSISVFGHAGCSAKDREDIGVVFDELPFAQTLFVSHLGRIMKGIYQNWDQKQYEEYLQKFALPDKKELKDFSRGMKMKLTIAVALSHQARLLVLDEATAGLDPIVRDEILELFNEFTRDETHSVLISSHILSDLEKLCDYIAFLHQGRLLFCEEKDALLEQYGIFNDTAEQAEALMPEAIVSMETTPYGGVRALVRRELAPVGFQLEKPTIEDIILALVKGEKQ